MADISDHNVAADNTICSASSDKEKSRDSCSSLPIFCNYQHGRGYAIPIAAVVPSNVVSNDSHWSHRLLASRVSPVSPVYRDLFVEACLSNGIDINSRRRLKTLETNNANNDATSSFDDNCKSLGAETDEKRNDSVAEVLEKERSTAQTNKRLKIQDNLSAFSSLPPMSSSFRGYFMEACIQNGVQPLSRKVAPSITTTPNHEQQHQHSKQHPKIPR